MWYAIDRSHKVRSVKILNRCKPKSEEKLWEGAGPRGPPNPRARGELGSLTYANLITPAVVIHYQERYVVGKMQAARKRSRD